MYIQSLLYKEVFTLFTTKTVPVVYSNENSPDGNLYEFSKEVLSIKWTEGKKNIQL